MTSSFEKRHLGSQILNKPLNETQAIGIDRQRFQNPSDETLKVLIEN